MIPRRALSLLLLGTTLLVAACTPAADPTPEEPQLKPWEKEPAPRSIQGRITVLLRSQGDPSPVALVELALCKPAVVPAVRTIRDERWIAQASLNDFSNGFKWLDLRAMGLEVQKEEFLVARTRADRDGFFVFENIEPGEYVVYIQYSTLYAKGYWLQPVTLTADAGLNLTFETENMSEIYNKFR